MNDELQKMTSEIIQLNFELDEQEPEKVSMENVREKLIEKIEHLLVHDYEKLLWILYRVDVPEKKAIAAMADASEGKPSHALADLIIERQIQKAKTRIQFRSTDKKE